MSVFGVPAQNLIALIAVELKEKFKVKKPVFTNFVKTGAGKERAPDNPDWYYFRAASILYRVFKDGPIGVGSLRVYYGGKKNRGVRKHKFRRASGKIVRVCLQELEKLNFIKKTGKGRFITPKGQSYLSSRALQLKKEFLKEKGMV